MNHLEGLENLAGNNAKLGGAIPETMQSFVAFTGTVFMTEP